MRYYNRDLRDDVYGPNRLGYRRIAALVKWLPPEAALWRAMGLSWTEDRELLALNIEVLDSLRRAFLMANSKKGTQAPKPIHIPRPWQTEAPPPRRGTRLSDLLRDTGIAVVVVPKGGDE